jgi:hypothetical protein
VEHQHTRRYRLSPALPFFARLDPCAGAGFPFVSGASASVSLALGGRVLPNIARNQRRFSRRAAMHQFAIRLRTSLEA